MLDHAHMPVLGKLGPVNELYLCWLVQSDHQLSLAAGLSRIVRLRLQVGPQVHNHHEGVLHFVQRGREEGAEECDSSREDIEGRSASDKGDEGGGIRGGEEKQLFQDPAHQYLKLAVYNPEIIMGGSADDPDSGI